MCTLSFVPRAGGFAVGMNRDELRSRPDARAPKYFERNRLTAVYPSEVSGGTWIAANSYGLVFAVLNWYSVDPCHLSPKQRSRGELIPRVIFAPDFHDAQTVVAPGKLAGVLPFRLIGIDPRERTICEWRWDGRKVGQTIFPWVRKHWFSSSLSDTHANECRRATCMAAASGRNPVGPNWLSELHRSHRPFSGPYSICVHRPDAATVSYTEVLLNLELVSMRYLAGSPCESGGFHHVIDLPRLSDGAPIPAQVSETFSPAPALIP